MNANYSTIFRAFFICIAFFNTISVLSQCAGTGVEITICDKETDPSLQTFNLFDVLVGETPGGEWVANSNFDSESLNETTGIVNLWDINRFGEHTFTYTHSSCDTSSATVIINLGSYPGENNQTLGDNNVCQLIKTEDDDIEHLVDLFIFLDTTNGIIKPDINGVWSEDPGNLTTGVLLGEFFDFEDVPIGTYTFTYTTMAVDTCPERTAIIDVEVRRSPNSGIPLNINICETDDMSTLTQLDLFSRLVDADLDGEWTDENTPSTGEITSSIDFEINVQNIYNNFGPGSYSFSYQVLPEHPICEEQTSIFTVCIEKQINLQGFLEVACDGNAVLTYDSSLLDNGVYDLEYTVVGANLGTYSTTQQDVLFQNGIAQFNLFPGLTLSTSETLTIQINDIIPPPECGLTVLCTSIVNVPPEDFDMFLDPEITVSSTSACELDDIFIAISNAVDSSFNLINGVIPVTYSINSIAYIDDINFVNGTANYTVPVSRFSQGSNQLFFSEIDNNFIHCGDLIRFSNLNLIPAPPNPVFNIIPDDRCDATQLEFSFDSPAGQFISYNSVTFDIYPLGSEPNQFDARNPLNSLTNNTQGDGVDINITNANDVSELPDGDYVFVIRSVQDDNAPCRALSQQEIDDYAALGIEIGLTKVGIEHIFDARLTFRIGDQEPVSLMKNEFEVCLINGSITLADLSLFAGVNVVITIMNSSGFELNSSYEITQNEELTAIFEDENTGCELGMEQITITTVTEASTPVLNDNVFCSLLSPTVADLDNSNENIIWYDQATNGTAYSDTEPLDTNNAYWAEITITGGCVSSTRTQAVINFVDKPNPPIVLENEFCLVSTPTIADLSVESQPESTLQWYSSQTGEAYTSTSLDLEDTNEYWVSQIIAGGCESDRVRVPYTLTNAVTDPIPLTNNLCLADNPMPTLEDLVFNDDSISSQGTLLYFSDENGTNAIPSTEALNTLTSPIYVQQNITGTCFSSFVEVQFALQNISPEPTLLQVELCLENNPTVQDLINLLQIQTSSTIILYEDETTTIPIDISLELASISGAIYASQIADDSCGESMDRTLVDFILTEPLITISDFEQIHCSTDNPTLSDVYLGGETILWFDNTNAALLSTHLLEDGVSYFAQLQVGDCLSELLEVNISLLEVFTPEPSNFLAEFCGIEEKTISDLLEDETGNPRFNIPENHSLVWYDSNDVSIRNLLDEGTILEQTEYYATYQVNEIIDGESISCESNSIAIQVDLTICAEEELIIPDAFSPNGDQKNDTFELKNIQFVFPDYNIEIYNRHGSIVFKGDTEIGFWDGTSNQSGIFGSGVMPTGVYFYIIKFNRNNKKPLQGQVYLKR